MLFSTDVATLFLERQLRIRFFTPAVRRVFRVLPGDVGRPLADLRPLPEAELQAVFEAFRQLDNPARERAKGFGLGLSIVQRLAGLLGHRVRVASRAGRGSMFAVEVPLAPAAAPAPTPAAEPPPPRRGTILLVQPDGDLRGLLAGLADATASVQLGGGRTLLPGVAAFTVEKLELPPRAARHLRAERETWLLVIGGELSLAQRPARPGDAIFLEADAVGIEAGPAGLRALIAYPGEVQPDLVSEAPSAAQHRPRALAGLAVPRAAAGSHA